MKQFDTFLELLESGEEFECELIIGGAESPATFCWTSENKMTEYGIEYYQQIMEAKYEILPNGNIEILCDDDELGYHFTMAAAGHISDAQYHELFIDGTEED